MTENKSGQLGNIVSWRVPTQVSYSTLLNALAKASLDQDLATELAPLNALRRALHEMRQGRVIRKLRREDRTMYFQFTREYLAETHIVYQREAELSLNVDTGIVRCDGHPEIEAEAQRLLAEHKAKRLTGDLTRLMHRVYSAYSADLIPVREQGGAYFVPDVHSRLVDQSRTLLAAIGGKLRSFEVRLGSDDTAESVAESMSEYLSQMIDEFRASCDDLTNARQDTIARRMESVAEIKRKLELYRGLLSGYADTVNSAIENAEAELLRKIAERDAALEEHKEAA